MVADKMVGKQTHPYDPRFRKASSVSNSSLLGATQANSNKGLKGSQTLAGIGWNEVEWDGVEHKMSTISCLPRAIHRGTHPVRDEKPSVDRYLKPRKRFCPHSRIHLMSFLYHCVGDKWSISMRLTIPDTLAQASRSSSGCSRYSSSAFLSRFPLLFVVT